MPQTIEEFIHHQNVTNYKRQLALVADNKVRARLLALLEHEKANARAEGWPPSLD